MAVFLLVSQKSVFFSFPVLIIKLIYWKIKMCSIFQVQKNDLFQLFTAATVRTEINIAAKCGCELEKCQCFRSRVQMPFPGEEQGSCSIHFPEGQVNFVNAPRKFEHLEFSCGSQVFPIFVCAPWSRQSVLYPLTFLRAELPAKTLPDQKRQTTAHLGTQRLYRDHDGLANHRDSGRLSLLTSSRPEQWTTDQRFAFIPFSRI